MDWIPVLPGIADTGKSAGPLLHDGDGKASRRSMGQSFEIESGAEGVRQWAGHVQGPGTCKAVFCFIKE
jgi:hypothetical protein